MILIFLKIIQLFLRIIFLLPDPVPLFLMQSFANIFNQIINFIPLKKEIEKNLKFFFPQASANQLLQNFSYSAFEFLSAPFFKMKHLETICQISGLENLDLALAERKGAILLTMHTFNYELVPIFLSALGYPLTSIIKAEPHDPIMKFINKIRVCRGTKLINVLSESMFKESLKDLSENRVVGLLLDTGASETRHEIMSFLGHKVPVATSWLVLAQRAKAPILPCFIKREGKKTKIIIEPFQFLTPENKEKIKEALREKFENFISHNPDQWGMFLNIYETRRMIEGGAK